MNRRGFLKALAASAVGMTLDPERLLWRPGAKTIVVMNGNPFWSSQLATSDSVLTYEMLQRAIKQIEDQIGKPPQPQWWWTSQQLKARYDNLMIEEGANALISTDSELGTAPHARAVRAGK